VIVRLAGGLGNQIFQFGAALYLSNVKNQQKIQLDISALGLYDVKREFELDSFFDLKKVNITAKKSFLLNLRLPVHFAFPIACWPLVGDKNFSYVKNCTQDFPMLLDGYFQTCLSQFDFDHISKNLKNIMSHDLLKERKNTCVIHVRGGDFVDLGWSELTPKDYYLNAINLMKEKNKVNSFIVVTDDIDYAKSIIPYEKVNFDFQSNNMVDDFKMLASSSNRILSASTFSLWASALGVNSSGCIVLAPREFTPGVSRNFLLPNEIRM